MLSESQAITKKTVSSLVTRSLTNKETQDLVFVIFDKVQYLAHISPKYTRYVSASL